MAIHVLLSFEDDDLARRFVEKVNGAFEYIPERKARQVLGFWKAPRKFCECTDLTEKDERNLNRKGRAKKFQRGWTRGKRYGWWVCSKCRKPSKHWEPGLARYDQVLGSNLLPGSPDTDPTKLYGERAINLMNERLIAVHTKAMKEVAERKNAEVQVEN
jgi:hypothetical protein